MPMFIPTLTQAKDIIDTFGSPVYVTDAAILKQKANVMLNAFSDFNLKIFYALKANYNPSLVRKIKEAGIYGI